MARLQAPVFLSGQDLYSTDTNQNHRLGTLAYGTDGRMFRYAKVGGSALVVGNLLQEAAQDTQFENMAVTASAIATSGAVQTVNITNGSTTVVPADFLGGSISVYTAGGEAVGAEYSIEGITGTLTTGGALVVTLDRPIGTAWTTALKVNMKKSPWANVIQAPASTQTGIAVGVALIAAAASSATVPVFTWVQTHGLATVLSDGSTFAVGSDIGTPSGTAGCATVFAAGTTHQRIGVVRQAAASAHCISVFLQID